MKKFFVFLGLSSLMACESGNGILTGSEMNEEPIEANVSVRVNDFLIVQEEMPTTRTTSVENYNGVKFLTLAFYKSDGTEQFKATHAKDSMPEGATFGEFTTSLPMGSYTMVVLGYALYNDDALTVTSPTQAEFTVNAPRETFAATQAVNVTSTSALNLSTTLNRIVSQLKVISSDNRTANISNVRMTFSAGGKRFSPTTGLATVNTGFSNRVGISSAVGAKSASISYLFLDTDEQDIDVAIETLDADGNTLFSKTIEDVPFKRNRVTKLTGAMYTNSGIAGAFAVSTDWLSEINVNF